MAVPDHHRIVVFYCMHASRSLAIGSQSAGGPRRLNIMMVAMVSFLQQGHCFGLYACGAAQLSRGGGGGSGGNCAFISSLLCCLLVLLSIPKCRILTKPFGIRLKEVYLCE